MMILQTAPIAAHRNAHADHAGAPKALPNRSER